MQRAHDKLTIKSEGPCGTYLINVQNQQSIASRQCRLQNTDIVRIYSRSAALRPAALQSQILQTLCDRNQTCADEIGRKAFLILGCGRQSSIQNRRQCFMLFPKAFDMSQAMHVIRQMFVGNQARRSFGVKSDAFLKTWLLFCTTFGCRRSLFSPGGHINGLHTPRCTRIALTICWCCIVSGRTVNRFTPGGD